MGWWGTDILEGDTPLDCKGEICQDILGMGEDYTELTEVEFDRIFRNRFNVATARKQLRAAVNKRAKITWQSEAIDERVFCQVAALMVIENGHMHDESTAIINAGRAAAERERESVDDAGWSHPDERFRHLTAFIKHCDEALGNDTEGEQENTSTQEEFLTAIEGLVPIAVADCFSRFEANEHTQVSDLCGEIHDRIMRMLDESGLGEAVEEAMEDNMPDEVVTVTFLVNRRHKINERKRSLTAELRRVQENSEVGLTLKDFDIK